MKKIFLCVATKKGLESLKAAVCCATNKFVVCTFQENGVVKSHHADIQKVAIQTGIKFAKWNDFKINPIRFIEEHNIGSILCVGWKYLISNFVVEALEGNVVIAHDSLLPKLRGFAPLVSALISHESKTGVTFCRAAEKVDSGNILWQKSVSIDPTETIGSLIEKVIPLYKEGATLYIQGKLQKDQLQDENEATYSIWRDDEDYYIDWSYDAETIDRVIRALGEPYVGARTIIKGKTIVIHKAEVLPNLNFALRQPGKIWNLNSSGQPEVICGKGLLRILSATCDGESILPLKSLRLRFKDR